MVPMMHFLRREQSPRVTGVNYRFSLYFGFIGILKQLYSWSVSALSWMLFFSPPSFFFFFPRGFDFVSVAGD